MSGNGPANGGAELMGFIGLGIMGLGMVKNLINKLDRKVIVWNRDATKSQALAAEFPNNVVIAKTAQEVVESATISISMLSTLEASEAVFDGVLAGVSAGKAIIDCATLTPERMTQMYEAVKAKGGKFLEAPVSGSKAPAEQGTLIFLTAGDQDVYASVEKELDAMGKAKYFHGKIGAASRMKIVVNMCMGGMMAVFAESISLASASELPLDDLLSIIDLGAMSCPMFKGKGPNMIKRSYNAAFPLKHAQKDMRFAVELGDKLGQTLPLSAAANEVFKKARNDHGDDDFSAVLEALWEKK